MASEEILFNLAAIFLLGIGAQWLSWWLRLPSILLLLTFGFLAGPVFGHIAPDEVFPGELLPVIVSMAVGLILFEGGMTLHFRDLPKIAGSLWSLLSVGVVVTWLLTTLAAFYLLQMPLSTSFLLGAILVVTGPTVVGPLLKHIRPIGRVGAIARWEGIVVDPIGALMAVLVFEATLGLEHAGWGETTWHIGFAVVRTLVIGGGLGILGAGILIAMFWRFMVPDALHNPVVITVVVAVFCLSNYCQHESGLLAVTLMGILLANQHFRQDSSHCGIQRKHYCDVNIDVVHCPVRARHDNRT